MPGGVERMLQRDDEDGRSNHLPKPAVNLAARVAQLARAKRRGTIGRVELLITDDGLLLLYKGKAEDLGEW